MGCNRKAAIFQIPLGFSESDIAKDAASWLKMLQAKYRQVPSVPKVARAIMGKA